MTQAELLLDEHRLGRSAENTAIPAATGARQHAAALRLELKAQQRSKNWDAVLDLLRQLEQRDALDKTLMKQLRRHAHVENLKSRMLNPQALKEYWQTISSTDKKDSKLAAIAAQACTAIGDCVTARQIIEQSLDSAMGFRIGRSCMRNAWKTMQSARLSTPRHGLKSHPNDACLLLALGKLCVHCELWGKAQNYLEASLSVEPGYPAHLALAQLNEKIGRPELAKDHYGKGLGTCVEAVGSVRAGASHESTRIRTDNAPIKRFPASRPQVRCQIKSRPCVVRIHVEAVNASEKNSSSGRPRSRGKILVGGFNHCRRSASVYLISGEITRNPAIRPDAPGRFFRSSYPPAVLPTAPG